MKKNSSPLLWIFLATLILYPALSLSGCEWRINCDGYYYHQEDDEYPAYIDRVWPAPGGEFSLACYRYLLDRMKLTDKGVGLTVDPRWIDTDPMDDSNPPITPRIELFIDDEIVSRDLLTVVVADKILNQYGTPYPIPGIIWMVWEVELERGEHEATVQVTRDTGEIMEYSWSFTITR